MDTDRTGPVAQKLFFDVFCAASLPPLPVTPQDVESIGAASHGYNGAEHDCLNVAETAPWFVITFAVVVVTVPTVTFFAQTQPTLPLLVRT
jgi:hypothetical protein